MQVEEDRLIGILIIIALTGYSRSWIYELIKEGGKYEDENFPKPKKPKGKINRRQNPESLNRNP